MQPRRSVLSSTVARELLQAIIAGEYPAGMPLPSERELQERFGVSRPVVREALKSLASRGLVTTSPGQSAIVTSNLTGAAADALLLAFHRSNVSPADLLDVRELLEPPIAAMAAEHATPVQIRRLRALSRRLADEWQADGANRPAPGDNDLNPDAQLHILLAEASQNPVLPILIDTIVGILWRQHSGVPITPEQRALAIRQHEALIEAVAARDPAGARAIMTEHLQSTRAHITNLEANLAISHLIGQ